MNATLREAIAGMINQQIGVLTAGTTSFIGWESGVLLRLEDDFVTLRGDGYLVTIPVAQIQRIRRQA